jgi:hypothetical protein
LSRGDELRELAGELVHAMERARRLGLPTTVYLLSMALVEAREAAEAEDGTEEDGGDDDGAA